MTSATLSFSPNENGKGHFIVDDIERHKYYVLCKDAQTNIKDFQPNTNMLTGIDHTCQC